MPRRWTNHGSSDALPPYSCSCGNPHTRQRMMILKDGTKVIRANSRCGSCNRAYISKHRKRWSEMSDEERKKMNVRAVTGQRVKRGVIIRKSCEVCQDPAEAHHDDYDKPNEIRWLCRKHHLAFHAIADLLG